MNVKGNRQVVYAEYKQMSSFKIPDGIDLNDKKQVTSWHVYWNVLYIQYAGTDFADCVKIEPTINAEEDFCVKRPSEVEITEDEWDSYYDEDCE